MEPRPETSAPAGQAGTGEPWAPSVLKAASIIVLAWAGFLLVPDRLLAYLTTRVTPHARDALVAGWVTLFFVVLARVFVVLQRDRRA